MAITQHLAKIKKSEIEAESIVHVEREPKESTFVTKTMHPILVRGQGWVMVPKKNNPGGAAEYDVHLEVFAKTRHGDSTVYERIVKIGDRDLLFGGEGRNISKEEVLKKMRKKITESVREYIVMLHEATDEAISKLFSELEGRLDGDEDG